jgi:hypothetical protein
MWPFQLFFPLFPDLCNVSSFLTWHVWYTYDLHWYQVITQASQWCLQHSVSLQQPTIDIPKWNGWLSPTAENICWPRVPAHHTCVRYSHSYNFLHSAMSRTFVIAQVFHSNYCKMAWVHA